MNRSIDDRDWKANIVCINCRGNYNKTQEKGLFQLTGSQQYQMMKNVSESFAGRVAVLELSGLSLREPFISSQQYIDERGKTTKDNVAHQRISNQP